MNENKNLEFVEIQVHGTKDKPYYEIHYIENGEHHIGYSSYNIKYVSDWLKEFFIKPVVHGHWKNVKRVLNSKWGECSNCDRCHEVTRYCPYCGAKMDESEESKNV